MELEVRYFLYDRKKPHLTSNSNKESANRAFSVFLNKIESPGSLCAGPLQCNMGEPAITRSIVGIPPYYNQRYYSFHNFQSEFSRTPTKYRVCHYNKCFSNLSITLVAISLSVCLCEPPY